MSWSLAKSVESAKSVDVFLRYGSRLAHGGGLAPFQKIAQTGEKLRRQGIVVIAARCEKLFRLVGGGKEPRALCVGNEAVAGAVADEDGFGELADLAQIVELVAHQPANRQPGIQTLAHVGQRAKRLRQRQATVALFAMSQLDRDAAAQRAAVNQDLIGIDILFFHEP